jgi:hypothetical protein
MILFAGQRSCTACAIPRRPFGRHLDIGAHQRDVGSGFQDGDGLGGIQRFEWRESGVFHHVDHAHAKHHLILDNENDGGSAEMIKCRQNRARGEKETTMRMPAILQGEARTCLLQGIDVGAIDDRIYLGRLGTRRRHCQNDDIR